MFSLINVIGLASGLACFVLISLYVVDELSYDRYNEKADRIYRVNSDILFGGSNLHLAVNSDPMGPTLKKDYPEVEEYVRFYASNGYRMLKKGSEYVRENNVAHADSTLFNVFTLPLVSGNPQKALTEPNSVVISASTAKKYFGTTDVVGRQLETDEKGSTLYKITAVMKDIPHNSHFNFDFIFSMHNVDYPWGSYLSHNFQTYILLKPGVNYRVFEKKLDEILVNYVLPQAKQFMNINSMDEFRRSGNKLEYSLMPVTDIHLHSDRFPELGVNGSIQYVYIFSAVAIFILLLACINFMNLSTARSSTRAKEVGIRKVLGSEKHALVRQFLTESTLTAIIATLLSLAIVWLILPWFNDLSGKELPFASIFDSTYLPYLLLLPVIVGIIAGVYPAFLLSSFRPVVVLKGVAKGQRKAAFRNALVIFQFTTSIVLIIGTLVVYQQLNFVQKSKLGFNKDQMLIVNGTGALGERARAFRNEVEQLPGVTGSTFADYLPVQGYSRNDNSYSKDAVMDANNSLNMQTWVIDDNYIPLMGMELLKGRNFSKDFGTDSSAVIINEATAKLLGYADPIGKKIYTNFDGPGGTSGLATYEVVGVVRNFHFESMRQQIGPLCFRFGDASGTTAFKVKPDNLQALISAVGAKWKSMVPDKPFDYQFMDQAFDNMYRVERRTGQLGLTLAIIAILIACLGLFGLATFTAEQRIKEIGIRKVLGASVPNIVTMLSKNFLWLVLLASVAAFPIAWWAMNKWLEDFAYRVHLQWWVFLVAAVMALGIALLTVSLQAIRAALSNPVKNLRTE
ncbi:MAG: ABC transporter permease [Flavisolibacter sp.]